MHQYVFYLHVTFYRLQIYATSADNLLFSYLLRILCYFLVCSHPLIHSLYNSKSNNRIIFFTMDLPVTQWSSHTNPLVPGKFGFNSLAPGKFELNFRYLIFQIISAIDGWVISCELALRWMSFDLTDDKSTLVQVMAWCCQATSHYLSQCWPRSLLPYGVTRPHWINLKLVIFKLISRIDILSSSCEITLRRIPQDLTDD